MVVDVDERKKEKVSALDAKFIDVYVFWGTWISIIST